MNRLDILRSNATSPLGTAIHATELDVFRAFAGSEMHHEFTELYTASNGFLAFNCALYLRPLGCATEPGVRTVEQWNVESLWRYHFSEQLAGLVAFGEDIFGCQLMASPSGVYRFDPDVGTVEQQSNTLDEFFRQLIEDPEGSLGSGISVEWIRRNGSIPPERRLFPKVPFVLGGSYEIDNLFCGDTLNRLSFYGDLQAQLRQLPDGTTVDLRFDGDRT